jgi:hypothetical protein
MAGVSGKNGVVTRKGDREQTCCRSEPKDLIWIKPDKDRNEINVLQKFVASHSLPHQAKLSTDQLVA